MLYRCVNLQRFIHCYIRSNQLPNNGRLVAFSQRNMSTTTDDTASQNITNELKLPTTLTPEQVARQQRYHTLLHEIKLTNPTLSTVECKRIVKLQLHEQHIKQRKQAEKQRYKQNKKLKKSQPHATDYSDLNAGTYLTGIKRRQWLTEQLQKRTLSVIVDLSYDCIMSSKECKSLGRQISYMYSNNLKTIHPINTILTSVHSDAIDDLVTSKNNTDNSSTSTTDNTTTASGNANNNNTEHKQNDSNTTYHKHQLKHPVDYLNNIDGFDKWCVTKTDQHYTDYYNDKIDSIVYLTAESTNVLHELHPDKLYVIGGLCDHNTLPGHVHLQATKYNVTTARLPIDEYIDKSESSARVVLPCNLVYDVLLQAWQHVAQKYNNDTTTNHNTTIDWADVFATVLPKRFRWRTRNRNGNIIV